MTNPYYSVVWVHQEINESVQRGWITPQEADDWMNDPDLPMLAGYIL